ncbi:MAG: GNAT family N-acetyltransferase [Defluviitaleaceae bacterium]|nr:GNAT family N-acetyltransferase [Defluviitaleaceae bacterium]MCL2239538.1 GNAT family N-acetyltransferase [Defluviitaleaceae bacterium]
MIELERISILDDNMKECIALEVLPEQEDYVASNAYSLAAAYTTNRAFEKKGTGDVAVPYAVYEKGTMVGFAMYGYFPPGTDADAYCTKEPHYYFWRLLVDKNHQGRGIGRETVRQIMEEIKARPCGEASYCYVSYEPKNIASKTTFASYGFEEDGRVIDGEVVARFKI